jgi:hypothetical protein
MSLKARLRVENLGVLVFSVFYAVAGGLMLFLVLASSLTAPPHIGVLALFSFITAYGLLQMRKWAVLLTTALFLLGVAFSVPVLYVSISNQTFSSSLGTLLLNSALIAYTLLSLFTFAYVAARRELFE